MPKPLLKTYLVLDTIEEASKDASFHCKKLNCMMVLLLFILFRDTAAVNKRM